IFREPGGKGFGGYDYGSMIYYYLLTILVSNLVTPTEDDWQIAADIREGQINSFLTKPLSYLGYRTGIFLAGRLVYTAVTIIPIGVQAVMKWLPFYYELFCPIAIFLGRLQGAELVQALAIQSCWLILTWAVAQLMWKRGLGHYQAVGG